MSDSATTRDGRSIPAERLSSVEFARQRRKQKTKSEGLLWSVLQGKQLCGLKFRREHPIDEFVTDFACVSEKLVVEIDGEYHDETAEADLRREGVLRQRGWTVIRFTAEDVEKDAEAVAVAIAKRLGRKFEFERRAGGGSGMKSTRAKKAHDGPPLADARPSQSEGEE